MVETSNGGEREGILAHSSNTHLRINFSIPPVRVECWTGRYAIWKVPGRRAVPQCFPAVFELCSTTMAATATAHHVTRTIKRRSIKMHRSKQIYARCVHSCCTGSLFRVVAAATGSQQAYSFQWSWNRFADAGKSSIFFPQNCISRCLFPFAAHFFSPGSDLFLPRNSFNCVETSIREQPQQQHRRIASFIFNVYLRLINLCLLWNFNFAWDLGWMHSIRCDSTIQFFTFYFCRSSWFIDGLCKLKKTADKEERPCLMAVNHSRLNESINEWMRPVCKAMGFLLFIAYASFRSAFC